MYLIRAGKNFKKIASKYSDINFCATIGNFDGIHLGHQAILNRLLKESSRLNASSLVFFTEPHASEYFSLRKGDNKNIPTRISPWREKFKLLREHGIEYAYFLKFNNDLQTMSPDRFIKDVFGSINLKSLIVGDDFKFGEGRTGDFTLLRKWGNTNNIDVKNTNTIEYLGKRISSTRIRKAIADDDFQLANALLGREYTFSGKVVHGMKIGRTIGVPTANIWLPKQKLPINGVYAVKCHLDGVMHNGIANMGTRPTIGGDKPVLEVHLFNFNSTIYSKRIVVSFIEKIRDERKFESINLLKSQIQKDIQKAINILKN